jgi:2-oxoglutarate ferredoxin oxidoreductase subunit alpha
VGGHFIQMEDELGSMAAIIGASAPGVKSMTATSGPGFSLKQENIGYACLAEIPCVIVDVQRSGPSTGLATSPSQGDYQQARWGTHGDHPMIAISPSSVRRPISWPSAASTSAKNTARPVIFLMDEIVGHMREGIEIPEPDSYEIVNRRVPATTAPISLSTACPRASGSRPEALRRRRALQHDRTDPRLLRLPHQLHRCGPGR